VSEEDRDLEMLRLTARTLRHEPGAEMLARVRSRVQNRIAAPLSPWEVLASWLRPAAISLAAILIVTAALFSVTQEPISVNALADSILIEWEDQLGGD
jgi:hypothetical protein